ncbi:MAG TPA: propanediol/glycerol family dehydratase large subunit, partial [Anaerovoracaceae bacterium]|nr:propanediol/glycerol family dehydratase large subunit [Anaerovoracaceae bacterium]
MKRSKRFEKLDKRPINQDSFFVEWAEGGLSAMSSPYDPMPGIRIEDGRIVEMDGKTYEDFDSLELFIAEHGINIEMAEYAMALKPAEIAKMIVDINVKREDVIRITTAITPAKMLQVVRCFNAVEIMMGQMKMRVRKTPANQAIVTNIKDNPALLAADAAEAALRGFSEIETTCAVSRYAPLNALSILVGGQTCRGGILTQCSMEESLEVKMGMRGLTSYAETVSLYGTEAAMDDGDDTIWSKAFLASIYASRGIKMRFTSGTGAEVLLGHSDKKSMLYLEILCVFLARSCGAQGVQNGSISCIGITTAVPEGFLAIAAENLVVSLLDMEVASGNDQTFSHSDMRRTAKLLMQMMPGTDFITSGYSATPNFDDLFAGSNTDCDDYDDYYMIQRDMQIDGGIEPILEEDAIAVRNKAAKACQAVFKGLGLPPITDDEVEAATYAYSNEEMPPRNMANDLVAAQEFLNKGVNAIDIVKALHQGGFAGVGDNVLRMLKERVCGDYLQVAAIFDKDFNAVGGLND